MSRSGSRCDHRRRGPNLCRPTLESFDRSGQDHTGQCRGSRDPPQTGPDGAAECCAAARLIHGRVPNEDPLTGRPPASAPIHNASARRAAGRVPGLDELRSCAAHPCGLSLSPRRRARLQRQPRVSDVVRNGRVDPAPDALAFTRRERQISRRHRPLLHPGRRHLLDHAALVDAGTSQPSSLPQLWIRVKVVPHLPGSANSDSASPRSEASSSSLSVSSRRDSSATLN